MIFPAYNPDPKSIDAIIELILFGFMFLFGCVGTFCIFLIRIFMMPKLDKKFSEIRMYPYFNRPLNRCSLYAIHVSSLGLKRNKKLKKIFGDYDFKSHTTRFEQLISNICMISLYLVVLGVLLFGIHYLIYCIEYWTR